MTDALRGHLQDRRAADNVARFPVPARNPAPADIEVSGATKRYDTKTVFDGIGFSVGRGQSVALIGSNGAGKSTLMRACAGLVRIDAGGISILQKSLSQLGTADLRRLRSRIGFVFQRHNLVPRHSALTNTVHGALGRAWGPRLWTHRLAPQDVREEALDCLRQVDLADIATQRCDTLSGGQSQRVAIARMLMQRPELILADEPVASLDPAAGREVMELLVRVTRERGLTLLFSSHHLDHARVHADRIIALKGGRIEFDGPPNGLSSGLVHDIYG